MATRTGTGRSVAPHRGLGSSGRRRVATAGTTPQPADRAARRPVATTRRRLVVSTSRPRRTRASARDAHPCRRRSGSIRRGRESSRSSSPNRARCSPPRAPSPRVCSAVPRALPSEILPVRSEIPVTSAGVRDPIAWSVPMRAGGDHGRSHRSDRPGNRPGADARQTRPRTHRHAWREGNRRFRSAASRQQGSGGDERRGRACGGPLASLRATSRSRRARHSRPRRSPAGTSAAAADPRGRC